MMRARWLSSAGLSLSILVASTLTGSLAGAAPKPKAQPRVEQSDRAVDEIALLAKKDAAATLVSILKKTRGRAEEPEVLIRLAETQQEMARFESRIANWKALEKKSSIDLTKAYDDLRLSIATLRDFMARYPTHQRIAHAYYLKAKAEAELQDNKQAAADLKYVIERFPNTPDFGFANITLWDLLIDQKEYQAALVYLKRFDGHPDNKYYPMALERLAWVYYYLKDVPTAWRYMEAQNRYYLINRMDADRRNIEREKILGNAVTFFAAGVEAKVPGFTSDQALDRLRALRAGQWLEKLLIKLTYFYRAKGLDPEIEKMKTSILASDLPNASKINFLIAVYDNELNKRNYVALKDTTDRVMDFLKTDNTMDDMDKKLIGKSEKTLTDSVEPLQKELQANLNQPEAKLMAAILLELYQWMLSDTKATVASLEKIHFNLAELFLGLKDYENAVTHYRWVVENGKDPASVSLVETSKFKSISTRFQSLKANKIVPEQLNAVSITTAQPKDISETVTQWIKWVDQALGEKITDPKKKADIDGFEFESNRILYSYGHVKEATDRLLAFAKQYPESTYAPPSASLAIDTYIATEDWDTTYRLARDYLNRGLWKGTDFSKKLLDIATDAYYKSAEAQYKKGNYQEALDRSNKLLDGFPKSKRERDALLMAANSALGLGQKKVAQGYYERLLRENPKETTEVRASAILTSAAVAEDQFDVETTTHQYLNFLSLPNGHFRSGLSAEDYTKLPEKALLLAWVSGKYALLKETMSHPSICGTSTAVNSSARRLELCEKYRALHELGVASDPSNQKNMHLFHYRYEHSQGPAHLIWAVAALQNPKIFNMDQRFAMLNTVAASWDKQDFILKYSLLPYLSYSIPEALFLSVRDIKHAAPVKLNKQVIAKRVRLMEQYEDRIAKLLELPWTKIQVAGLLSVAGLYKDLTHELKAIPVPKGLTGDTVVAYRKTLDEMRAPFDKKLAVMSERAWELTLASGVDVSELGFNDVLPKSQGPKLDMGLYPHAMINSALLSAVNIAAKKDESSRILVQALIQALDEKRWPRIAFFLEETKAKGALSEGVQSVALAVAYDHADALAQALKELDRAGTIVDAEQKGKILLPMITYYYKAHAKEKTKSYIEQFAPIKGKMTNSNWFAASEEDLVNEAEKWAESADERKIASAPGAQDAKDSKDLLDQQESKP